MSHQHLDRAEQQVLLVLRRAHARGRSSIPLPELVRSALVAGTPIDAVLADALQDLRLRGVIADRDGGIALV